MPLINDENPTGTAVTTLGEFIQKAQPNDVYIVVMSAEPVVAYTGQMAGLAATAPEAGSKINPNSVEVQNYVNYLVESHNAVLAAAGVDAANKFHSYSYALNGFAARLTPEQVESVATQPGVTLVLRDQLRVPQDDDVPAFLGLTEAGGAWAQQYTGEDVVVGVIVVSRQ